MKRLLFAVIAFTLSFNSGLSFAQDEDAPQIPEKVRAFLDKVTGTWDVSGSIRGTNEVRWNAMGAVLNDQGQYHNDEMSGSWSGVWYWDALSQDRVIVSWGGSASRGFSHGRLEGKVLSPSLMEGKRTGVRQGKPMTADVRIEFQRPDRYTWTDTNVTVGGEKQPDSTDVYTQVKPTTREDFEEFCQLFKGRWVCEMTLFDDRPGFGITGDKFTAYFHSTLSENGNYIVSRVNMGKAWQTQLKYYDPIAKVIKTTCELSSGATSYATDRKVPGGWRTNIVQIGADGTNEGELILDHTFSKDGKTWTVKVSSPGDESNILATYVWRRMNK